MTGTNREEALSRAFVSMADTLVSDFDLTDLLQTLVDTCTDLLGADAGGLLLADGHGELRLVASSSEDASLTELAQLGARSGPCLDCFRTGQPVNVGDIRAIRGRWPAFAAAALAGGLRSVHATPMRLREQVLGSMNLFSVREGALSPADVLVAQALTDVATIGILQQRSHDDAAAVTQQLQAALTSRVLIEQAKGVIAATANLPMEDGFALLRAHARRTNTSIRTIAQRVVEREIDLTPSTPTRPPTTGGQR